MSDSTQDALAGGAEPISDSARIRVELASRVARLTRLEQIGLPSAPMADITEVLDDVIRAVVELLDASSGALLVHDPRAGTFHLAGAHRLAPEMERQLQEAGTVDRRTCETAGLHRLDFEMLTLAGDLMGRIAVFFPTRPALDRRLLDAAEGHARQAAEMVERARMHGEARNLAVLEQRRGMQLRGLAEAALALSAETEVDALLRLVTEAARDLIGAHQAVASRLMHGWEEASTYVSLSEKYARWRSYDETPKGLGVLTYVTRENKPLRLTGAELVRHPDWRGLRDAPDHPPLPDYLAAPLIARDGRNLGLIQLSDKGDGTPFSAEDEAILVQLAQMASVSIENAELIDRERRARREAERQVRSQRLLSQASHAFSMSLDLEQTLSTVTATMVPEFADWCGVLLLSSSGELTLAASAALDGWLEDRIRDLLARLPNDSQREFGAFAVVRTGQSQVYPRMPEEALRALTATGLRSAEVQFLADASALLVPLPARGRTIGALAMLNLEHTPYGPAELEFAEELGRRAALAVENATSYELERQAADMMLRNLLPQALPRIEGVATGVSYRPGAAGARIGGDWYDVFALGEGRYGLVVGDVMGHGVAAAAAMGQMRSAVRAYALEGHGPAAVLDRLDHLVQQVDEMALTTCVVATLDTRRGVLTMASAGHLPPLLVAPDGAAELVELDSGLPLGVGLGQGAYVECELELPEGATCLLYTDGLVESRTAAIDVGLERLRRAAERRRGAAPQRLCDGLLEELSHGDHHDDIALLAIRPGTGWAEVPDAESGEDLTSAGVALLLDRRSPARARSFARERLVEWGCDEVLDEVLLLTSELVTNAQLHGKPPLDLRLRRTPAGIRVEVEDGSERLPLVHDYGLEAGTGRGMVLVRELADRWGAAPTPGGKVVWFEVRT